MATLIFKPTEACNSNCAYCDAVRRRRSARTMPLDLLALVFERIGAWLAERPEERFEVIWHGGEPLLLGPAYFEAALAAQERLAPEVRARITHSIQSNLTLFSEAYVDVLRRLGIDQIGSSFDPEPGIRGPGEAIDSAAYARLFMKGDALARRSGFASGLIYVVTRRSLARPLDVFHFLTNLRLGGGFSMNPVLVYGEDPLGLAITPDEYAEFLGAIFPTWWRHRDRYPDVDPFASYVRNVQGERRLACAESGSCAYHHLNIAPDGRASHCGRSSDWGLLDYGDLRERSLAEILADPKRHELAARDAVLREGECAGCRLWGICHGGCPLDAWAAKKSFLHRSAWCAAKKGFVERHLEPVTGLRVEAGA